MTQSGKGVTLTFIDQNNRFKALESWFVSPHGSYVAKAIAEELSPLNTVLCGDCLIQLGGRTDNPWLADLKFQHKWLLNPQVMPSDISCSTLMTALPIDRESVDCVIAPFTMDAFDEKEFVFDEMDRVLKPLGHIVFIGVNPLSLWGVWLKISRNNCFGVYKGFPRSVFSTQRALLHRGYLQCYYNGFYFIPPVRPQKMIRSLVFLNQVGKMISPTPSAFYCLVMPKHIENYIGPLLVERDQERLKSSPVYQPVC